MRCNTCRYSLEGLVHPPHRCPECGREFVPSDPSTYKVDYSIQTRVVTVLLVLAMILASVVVIAFSYRSLRGGF